VRDVQEGEEITCDYKYSLKKDPPDWYLQSLKKVLANFEGLKISDSIKTVTKQEDEKSCK